MTKKICRAGVVGPFSFLIVDTDRGAVVASIRAQQEESVKTYIDMDIAERFTERELSSLIGRRYEA